MYIYIYEELIKTYKILKIKNLLLLISFVITYIYVYIICFKDGPITLNMFNSQNILIYI